MVVRVEAILVPDFVFEYKCDVALQIVVIYWAFKFSCFFDLSI